MTKNFLFLAGLSLLITGCATTPQGLREDARAMRTFEVAENYQLVLKRIIEQHQQCKSQPLLPIGQSIFDVQHYSNLKEANIHIGASGFGTQIYSAIEILGSSNDHTKVTTWNKIIPSEFSKKMQQVAQGDPSC